MVLTVVLSVLAGLAFRKKFRGPGLLFYVAIASLIVPSIVTSLGIALMFRLIDDAIKAYGARLAEPTATRPSHGPVHLRASART